MRADARRVDPVRLPAPQPLGEGHEDPVVRTDQQRPGLRPEDDRRSASSDTGVDHRHVDGSRWEPMSHFPQEERGLRDSVSGKVVREVNNRGG